MDQRELRKKIKEQLNGKLLMTDQEIAVFIDVFLETVKDTVTSGEKVTFRNFGTFAPKKRASIKSTLPGRQPVIVPARWVPYFKPGQDFTNRMPELQAQKQET